MNDGLALARAAVAAWVLSVLAMAAAAALGLADGLPGGIASFEVAAALFGLGLVAKGRSAMLRMRPSSGVMLHVVVGAHVVGFALLVLGAGGAAWTLAS